MTLQNCDKLVMAYEQTVRTLRAGQEPITETGKWLKNVADEAEQALAAHRQCPAKGCEGTHDFKAAFSVLNRLNRPVKIPVDQWELFRNLSSAALQLAQSMEKPAPDRMAALDELRGLAFSDGAGAVCAWVNKHRRTIEAALTTPPKPTPDRVAALVKALEWVAYTGKSIIGAREIAKRALASIKEEIGGK